ncbi:uncharacterized protein FMAN_16279 [Fusarium mangiferae]|uniref:Uncharacterized protein n=1 Tax=Fusarium mangiferae TaxID=192010 RepID=A0A1L7UPU8_FUSMA|nr:uncharacterized protein FMAN_16279 [Fusarium mangiferae]CVL09366.1 uncharacterized protein FMAN_16279 [Fusarium mangiferae]
MAPMMKFFYAGLLAASTFTSAVFASPIDNIAVVVESRDVKYLSEGVNTPIGIDIANAVAVAVRNVDKDAASLEKRVFTSPHVRKAFKVVAGNMISAASWAFNFWVEEDYTGKSTLWYSGLTGGGVTKERY